MLVLGAGLQGKACAFDLLSHTDVDVTIADCADVDLPDYLSDFGGRLTVTKLDVRDEAAVLATMTGHAAVMSAIPYYFNLEMARLAVEAGAHFCDLGGNTEIVNDQMKLRDAAVAKGVCITPDCGLAPGMVNILAAEAIERLDTAKSVKMLVGGLPQHPVPPLNYQIVYSLEGALDYYTTLSWIVRDGKPLEIEALSEIEPIEFEAPLGTLEAFHTAGGLSTMPWDFEGRVDSMEYKTLRYPGHAEIMRNIRELGLLSMDPIDVKGQQVVPRDAFIAAVDPILNKPDLPDLVALRVIGTGTKDGVDAEVVFDLVDRRDTERPISAMMRVTGYSLAITGYMQATGVIDKKGVFTSAQCTPYGPYVAALWERGINIKEK